MPDPKKKPMTIKIPKQYYPTVVSHIKQSPIVVVPEIIYPKTKKRVIVHHEQNFTDMYRNMAYKSINPYYMKFAAENPAYKEMLEKNAFYQTAMKNGMYKEGLDKIPKMII